MTRTVLVAESDLKAALTLLKVYMGRQKPSGHFKGNDSLSPDAFYVERILNLERDLEAAIKGAPRRKPSPDIAARAAELASDVLDDNADASAPTNEQETRKARLLEGPIGFRKMHKD